MWRKGRITVQFTIWCGLCYAWEYSEFTSRRATGEAARARGWKLTRAFGWVCPEHEGF